MWTYFVRSFWPYINFDLFPQSIGDELCFRFQNQKLLKFTVQCNEMMCLQATRGTRTTTLEFSVWVAALKRNSTIVPTLKFYRTKPWSQKYKAKPNWMRHSLSANTKDRKLRWNLQRYCWKTRQALQLWESGHGRSPRRMKRRWGRMKGRWRRRAHRARRALRWRAGWGGGGRSPEKTATAGTQPRPSAGPLATGDPPSNPQHPPHPHLPQPKEKTRSLAPRPQPGHGPPWPVTASRWSIHWRQHRDREKGRARGRLWHGLTQCPAATARCPRQRHGGPASSALERHRAVTVWLACPAG